MHGDVAVTPCTVRQSVSLLVAILSAAAPYITDEQHKAMLRDTEREREKGRLLRVTVSQHTGPQSASNTRQKCTHTSL